MPILQDLKLRKKLWAIKRLRDRAGTTGEADAAQHRLTIILAKHLLTEQDLGTDPDDLHAFRSSFRPPPSYHANYRPPHTNHDQPPFTRDSEKNHKRKTRKTPNRARFEKAFGVPISDYAWRMLRREQNVARKVNNPTNPAAFARAFYEHCGFALGDRMHHTHTHPSRAKSKNFEGKMEGINCAERISLTYFQ